MQVYEIITLNGSNPISKLYLDVENAKSVAAQWAQSQGILRTEPVWRATGQNWHLYNAHKVHTNIWIIARTVVVV